MDNEMKRDIDRRTQELEAVRLTLKTIGDIAGDKTRMNFGVLVSSSFENINRDLHAKILLLQALKEFGIYKALTSTAFSRLYNAHNLMTESINVVMPRIADLRDKAAKLHGESSAAFYMACEEYYLVNTAGEAVKSKCDNAWMNEEMLRACKMCEERLKLDM